VKAAVTNEQHGFDVVDVPDPAPAADELVIRVAACGVCGSDIKAQPFAPPGMVMGHELGGEVVAIGSDVSGWTQGMNAAVLPVISCGTCVYCRAGAVPHCAQVQYIGMGPAGGFAEYAAVPARHAFAVPAELPSTFAALVEPFAVGLHGVHSAEIKPGDDVLIVGAGGVGLTTLAWARQKGAARVTVADPDSNRRNTALTLGATDALSAATEAEPGAYSAAIECVGRPELVQVCQPALRPQGRLVISGACAEPTVVEPITALLKELTIRYSVAYRPDEFVEVITAFATGAIDPMPMVGPTFGLDGIAEAFDAVRGAQVQGRVLVSPADSGVTARS
jgi:(R,R)-butanediol dehydrogenase / meso-butanediol dehydrogenase / diacetyl reductase